MRTRGELVIPRKLTVRAGHRKLVLAKRDWESERHVLLKALTFGRYVNHYPDLIVERGVGLRYKPDLVALDGADEIILWAECGETGRDKLAWLLGSLPKTHLVFARQQTRIDPFLDLVRGGWPKHGRSGDVEVINFPLDAAQCIGPDFIVPEDCPGALRFVITGNDDPPSG